MMAALLPTLLGVGSSMVGAGLNYYGTREANQMNLALADKQMAFQRDSTERAMGFGAEQAQKQMDFQERMSNTAYQRTMADMEAAGINPMLAFSQGGASTPVGSSASGVSAQGSRAEYQNRFATAVSSAMQMTQVMAQVEQTKALTELVRSELPEKKISSEYYSTDYGKTMKKVDLFTGSFGKLGPLINMFMRGARIPGLRIGF